MKENAVKKIKSVLNRVIEMANHAGTCVVLGVWNAVNVNEFCSSGKCETFENWFMYCKNY